MLPADTTHWAPDGPAATLQDSDNIGFGWIEADHEHHWEGLRSLVLESRPECIWSPAKGLRHRLSSGDILWKSSNSPLTR